MAKTSLSLESLPSETRIPVSTPIGIVNGNACGSGRQRQQSRHIVGRHSPSDQQFHDWLDALQEQHERE